MPLSVGVAERVAAERCYDLLMRVSQEELRRAWDSARGDADLKQRACVVILVADRMPTDGSEATYYRPGGPDRPHDHLKELVLRRTHPDVLNRYEWRHRVVIWAEIPGAPPEILGPLLRHELEHARQWQQYGRVFVELNTELREAHASAGVPGGYERMPAERAANLAAAAYAALHLAPETIAEICRLPAYRQFVDQGAEPLEGDVLTLTARQLLELAGATPAGLSPDQWEADLQSQAAAMRSWASRVLLDENDDQMPDLVVTQPYPG
jgi:hypothetical protein